MERITVENQVRNAGFLGYADDEDPADLIVTALERSGLAKARLGLEKRSLYMTPGVAERIVSATPGADWSDVSNLIDDLRLVKSPLERDYTRRAAATSDAGTMAAIEAIREGASDFEVAAECHRAMILAGSEYPGFGPFIRPTRRLGEEHTTWKGETLRAGDAVFLELSGSVRRYHAPMGRLVYLGSAPDNAAWIEALCLDGMAAIVEAVRPGVTAGEVYQAWQDRVDAAGLSDYGRHHCGYLVGIAFPPSWTGGSMVTSLRPGGDLEIRTGMVFHLHSWLTGTGRGDYFISNTAMLTENGCEVLTKTPETLQVR
jgi:Xaa-Pro dipeptidase